MCKTKFTIVIIVMIVFISLLSIFSFSYHTQAEPDQDMVITSYQKFENIRYILDGNLIVEDLLEIVNCNFEILQDYDNQYSIIVRNGGEIHLIDSKLMSISSDGGYKRPALSFVIEDEGILTIDNSVIDEGINIDCYETGEIYGEDSVILGDITLYDSATLTFVNTVSSTITANEYAVGKIYGKVTIKATDCAGLPVPEARVSVKNPLTGVVYDTKITSVDGETTFTLLTDIINKNTYPGSDFVGNYNISARYNGYESTYKQVVFPYYTKRSNGKISKNILYVEINIQFEKVLISPKEANYYSIGEDITISDHEDIMMGQGSWAISGSITLIEDGILTIKNTDLKILQEENARYYILVKDNSTLRIEGGSISSNYPLNLYLYDNATLEVKDATLDLNLIGARDEAGIIFENSIINSNINIRTRNGIKTPTNVIMKDTIVKSEHLIMETTIYDLTNCTFNKPLRFNDNSTAYLTDVYTPGITVAENGIVYTYWWLTVRVRDIENRPVRGCKVVVSRYNKTFEEEEYQTDFTDGNNGGKVKFKLLSHIIDAKRDVFFGNYKVYAYYQNNETLKSNEITVAVNKNVDIDLMFKELIGGPSSITVVALVKPTEVARGDEFIVAGLALLDSIERGRYCNVTVTIVETNSSWHTTTDNNGAFRISVLAPSKKGKYTVRVYVTTDHINGTAEKKIMVNHAEEETLMYTISTYMPWTILGLVISWSILYLSMRQKYKRLMQMSTETST